MAYTPTTYVNGTTPALNATNLNHAELGIQTADTTASAAVPKSLVTTAGDILYATASAVLARLGIGTAAQVLGGGASAPAWVFPPGYEQAYTEFTANVSLTGHTAATATTIVTASAFTFDGSVSLIEFFCPYQYNNTAQGENVFQLYQDGSDIGQLGVADLASTTGLQGYALRLSRRMTPSAGSHTYSIRGYTSGTSTGTAAAGVGGAGVSLPGYIRITKV